MYSKLFKVCVVSTIKVFLNPSTSTRNNHLSFSRGHHSIVCRPNPLARLDSISFPVFFQTSWCSFMVLDWHRQSTITPWSRSASLWSHGLASSPRAFWFVRNICGRWWKFYFVVIYPTLLLVTFLVENNVVNYFEMNVIYWAVLRSARLVISRSNEWEVARARLKGAGFKSQPTNGKLLGLSCLLTRSRCCSNEHSYRVACVVGKKKKVYCTDDILPKKRAENLKKDVLFTLV